MMGGYRCRGGEGGGSTYERGRTEAIGSRAGIHPRALAVPGPRTYGDDGVHPGNSTSGDSSARLSFVRSVGSQGAFSRLRSFVAGLVSTVSCLVWLCLPWHARGQSLGHDFLPRRWCSWRRSRRLTVEECDVRWLQYQTVSDLVRYCDGGGCRVGRSGCGCGVRCGVRRFRGEGDTRLAPLLDPMTRVTAMADTLRETMVAEALAPHSARGLNARAPEATDCSKPAIFNLPKSIPCETPKEQDMAAMRSCIAAADSGGMKTLQHIVESLETRLQSALMQAIMQILETIGKDAAARVVMAERKASVMEQEHINTKQQALAMMLRIKHSSDSMLVDAEKRVLLEKRRSHELESQVYGLQDAIRKLKAELKKQGDILEELRRAQLDAGTRSGLMSPSEGVSKKRKGNPQVKPIEVRTIQPGLVEDECDDTGTLLATMLTRSPSADRLNSVLGRGLVPPTPQNPAVQDFTQNAPTHNKQGSLRRYLDDVSSLKLPSHRQKESKISAYCTAEQNKILAESKSTRAKPTDVAGESSDQHDSSLEGPSHIAERKSHFKHDSLANGEEMESMDDGFPGLVALRGASQILQNGGMVSGLKSGAEANNVGVNDSSTDDEDEYQSKQEKASRCGQRNSDECTVRRNKVPDASKSSLVDQTMVLRRTAAARRGKQHISPKKSEGPVAKEMELLPSEDIECAEIGALAKLKGGAEDAADGSGSLVVETSRDSRRLMQGARQLLSLRKL